MATEEGKYNIKAVSKMLGIQPGTLRAWERRYQIVAPKRNESGHRLYTEEHIKVLKWLIRKVDQGFSISQAVSLLENKELNAEPLQMDKEGDRSGALANELLEALLQFNETKAHDLINQAFSFYTIDKVLIDILGSLLVKIGHQWEEGKITSAHEHFASSILRSRIGMILHSFPHNGVLPKVIAVCGPGEAHELGLLIFTLFLRRRGFEVVYLGTSIAEEDIETVIEIVKPKFIFLSCTMKSNVPETLKLSESLAETYGNLHVGIGGFGIDALSNEEKTKYEQLIPGSSTNEWEEWIRKRLQ
ncbi:MULTISPECIES: MerR family transcriptional regulator [Cytobacillus]|uniref:MerR family transcriptional regulator n=1 Tax=Cytobacillus TaxID=2675230 RepID=UPI0020424802|nr:MULTISPECIES: MerR family transcriptional regulator [Cytobacillus]MCS0826480.1 MerR family transcriptional regulator [Cytobacillus firmus]MCM3243627.1 MerR family transcriptional regulator [Cytobacillus oceanisediminis]MCM3393896.1 MerR family transcriptional regulator [Cytobacillus oceanisediminis]UQX54552.1 MerR family transcriptional regulator [Cytobacillus pseudoceanisediminis]USK42951.1 MerR family transcriptional regulator [Cytobacillus oceanisediminis]